MEDFDRRAVLSAAGVVGLAALAARGAGPLDPPAGAVAPTGRTLDEIYNRIPTAGASVGRTPIPGGASSVTITQPGSYILTGDITVASSSAINISGNGVDIDLNGYALTTASTTAPGISISNVRDIVIRNGRVVGGLHNVTCSIALTNAVFEDLLCARCKQVGIFVNIPNARNILIRRCTIVDAGAATTAADGSLGVLAISGAQAIGLQISDCTVHRFVYNGSGSGTFTGISAGTGLVSSCYVSHDVLHTLGGGLLLATGGIFRDNSVRNFSVPFTGGTNAGGNFSA